MITRILVFLAVLLLPVAALAQTAAGDDLIGMARQAWEAGQGGAWGLATGVGIMLLTKLAAKFNLLNWIPDNGKRWFVLGLAMLGGVGTGLAAGAGVFDIVVAGVSAAVTAVGSNEYLKTLRRA